MAKPPDAALQEAIDALRIRDVYLRESGSFLAEGFEPKYDPAVDALRVEFQHVVKGYSVLEVDHGSEAPTRLFRVFIQLGARLVGAPDAAEDVAETAAADPQDAEPSTDHAPTPAHPVLVRAEVSGMMVAEYDIAGDPSSAALEAFARRNASYHVWPYWREFLASQCARMNLPKLVLPAVQVARPPQPESAPKQ